MSKEEIKDAFGSFHNEKYTDAEEKIDSVVRDRIGSFLKDKLNLKVDPIKGDTEE